MWPNRVCCGPSPGAALTMAWGLPSTTSLAHFCQKLNRLKPLEESTTETSLRRCLTTLDLTLMGMGATVGSGLYVISGTVAKEMTGPAVLVSFSIAAMAFLLAALCYVEFGARVPRTGSAYLFTYVSLGELWAFLIGWNVLLGSLISGASVARASSSYLDAIFSHRIRNFTMAHVGIWQVPFLAQYPDFLAAGVTVLASTFVSCGARVSSWLNHVLLAINLLVILFIIILGFVLARPYNWSADEGGFAPFGFSGIMAGAATCFYAYLGLGVIAVSSEEAQNPKRAVPMAIIITLGLVAGTNILVSTVLTLIVPWHSLDPDSALADAFYQRGYSWVAFIVAAGAICGSHGAPDSSPEHPPQRLPHAAAELTDLAELVRLAADWTHGVFWLRHLAQQGEPAGAARVDCHTRQPGGDSTGPAVPQPGTGPVARPHGAARQSMRTAGGLPALLHLLTGTEGLAAPFTPGNSGFQDCPCQGVLRTSDLSPGAELRVFGSGPWPLLVVDSAQYLPVYDQLQLPGQVEQGGQGRGLQPQGSTIITAQSPPWPAIVSIVVFFVALSPHLPPGTRQLSLIHSKDAEVL
ncbi:cationic amino acid transporter 4-like isoform X3 [Equus przewalskii]|uniref:Cationic amino acid transporter 4-like isoform X3 n=1 Tax=Equus przewalskii TaxID=9798 RepID=A0ABM4Q5V5_EQUPR